MNETVKNYLRAKNIDSFQKLRLLLFFYQNPEVKGSSQELATYLHLGDTVLVEKMMQDLHNAGLLKCTGHHYQLFQAPEVRVKLQHLAKAFEHPLTRQELLKHLKYRPAPGVSRISLTRLGWSL
jgi:hypothetical protein